MLALSAPQSTLCYAYRRVGLSSISSADVSGELPIGVSANMSRWVSVVFLILSLATGVVGCESTTAIRQPPHSIDIAPPDGNALPRWTAIRFRLARQKGEAVNSYLDALIADRILAPTLVREQRHLKLWRFHRRWPNDPTGHQFSLLLYAPEATARRLVTQVQANPLLEQLRNDGHLIEWRAEPPSKEPATDPADTSDRSWPPAVQNEWPKFIMGASQMWLGLVQSESTKHSKLALHARYQAVEKALDRLWFEQANHAFFHHLSALFGYKPVRVIRRDIMTF